MSELTQELKESFQRMSKNRLGHELTYACDKGYLSEIQYLLTSPELNEHADIHYDDDLSFKNACSQGRLDTVKYLLTSPELKEHADIYTGNDEGFILACMNGHLDIVQYLLTSKELDENSDIHADGDGGFQWAYKNGHLDIISFFIFDQQIEKTMHINDCLTKIPNEQIENWFKLKELNKTLESELISEEVNMKKFKI